MINYLLTAYILAEIGAPIWTICLAIFCATVKLIMTGGGHS